MTEGSALLSTMFYAGGTRQWDGPRGSNMLGGAAPFYDTYETEDGGFIALAPLEPQFFALFLDKVGLAGETDPSSQMDREVWPAGKARPTDLFKTRTRAEWCDLLEGTDACFAPVLSMREAPDHPHNRARGAFVEAFGLVRPAPAPRYSRSATRMPMLPVKGADSQWLLREAGFAEDRIRHLLNQGIVVADRG